MKPLLLLLTGLLMGTLTTDAQISGHLGLRLEVLPVALRITVTSAEMDFARQHSNAGRVMLDPATGEISQKASGAHRFGEVWLTGPAGSTYALAVTTTARLQGQHTQDDDPVHFELLWAQNGDCQTDGFTAVIGTRSTEGMLGAMGCSRIRFGGVVDILGAPEGHYEGRLLVNIVSL